MVRLVDPHLLAHRLRRVAELRTDAPRASGETHCGELALNRVRALEVEGDLGRCVEQPLDRDARRRSPRPAREASGDPATAGAGEPRPTSRLAFVRVGAEAGTGFERRERGHVRLGQGEVEQPRCSPGSATGSSTSGSRRCPAAGASAARPGRASGRADARFARRPDPASDVPCPSGLHASVAMPCVGVEPAQLLLLQVRVQLDLVDRRDDVGLVEQPLEMVGLEVGDADRPDPPVGVQLLQGPPRLDVRDPGSASASGSGRGRRGRVRAARRLASKAAACGRSPGRRSTAWW